MKIYIYTLYLTIISIITQQVKCQTTANNFTELVLRNQRQYCNIYTSSLYTTEKIPEKNYQGETNNMRIKPKKPRKKIVYPAFFRSENNETPDTSDSNLLINKNLKLSVKDKNKLQSRKVTYQILQPSKSIIMECNQANLQSLWNIYAQTVLEILKINERISKMSNKAKVKRHIFKVKYEQRQIKKEIKLKNNLLDDIMDMMRHCLQKLIEKLTLSDILEYCKGIQPESCLMSEVKSKYLDIKLIETQLKMEETVSQILEKKRKNYLEEVTEEVNLRNIVKNKSF
ncbi:uncharacterized protein CMU_004420 [Cryptosporidium muris RN66]|uniref:Uncharacterized protein n=1 Tax=Cryptosporidium muris (strain RN66) TaxID=441375 RepID=B6AK52_CRYMR|nr:uncharacterized protein CMU_004420 [Cryptosporidium muris RN66]EEA08593.1 hypothetical protein CMU_004420 [Cryptosporidium muris RN66]|eukprot:XP_002142942.1 hypothetical protein [Cryptosporidium muris RN66]